MHREFGEQSNQHMDETPMALGSTLYDVFQKVIIDAQLWPYRSNERDIAFKHLQATHAKDLVLYDRGYPAFWLMAAHRHCQRHWCMRVKADFNTDVRQFVQLTRKQQITTFKATPHAHAVCAQQGIASDLITVRLIRVIVKKKTYILITNLLDTACVRDFRELYHRRWQIDIDQSYYLLKSVFKLKFRLKKSGIFL